MNQVWNIVRITHNAVGGITLLLVLAAAVVLLITARTTASSSALIVRGSLISASVQFILGVLLLVLGLVIGRTGVIASIWYHYALGLVSVGVISALAARARRAPDTAARRYGLFFLGTWLVVLLTFLIGQYRGLPFGG